MLYGGITSAEYLKLGLFTLATTSIFSTTISATPIGPQSFLNKCYNQRWMVLTQISYSHDTMDPDNLKTASLYINNLLLSRGLLRNGQSINFARPDKDEGGMPATMGRIMSVINDLILRRDVRSLLSPACNTANNRNPSAMPPNAKPSPKLSVLYAPILCAKRQS